MRFSQIASIIGYQFCSAITISVTLDQVAEPLIGQQRDFHTLRNVVKVLETKSVLPRLHADIGNDAIRQPPQGEISCILILFSGNAAVVALTVFHLEKLPCVAVPHK